MSVGAWIGRIGEQKDRWRYPAAGLTTTTQGLDFALPEVLVRQDKRWNDYLDTLKLSALRRMGGLRRWLNGISRDRLVDDLYGYITHEEVLDVFLYNIPECLGVELSRNQRQELAGIAVKMIFAGYRAADIFNNLRNPNTARELGIELDGLEFDEAWQADWELKVTDNRTGKEATETTNFQALCAEVAAACPQHNEAVQALMIDVRKLARERLWPLRKNDTHDPAIAQEMLEAMMDIVVTGLLGVLEIVSGQQIEPKTRISLSAGLRAALLYFNLYDNVTDLAEDWRRGDADQQANPLVGIIHTLAREKEKLRAAVRDADQQKMNRAWRMQLLRQHPQFPSLPSEYGGLWEWVQSEQARLLAEVRREFDEIKTGLGDTVVSGLRLFWNNYAPGATRQDHFTRLVDFTVVGSNQQVFESEVLDSRRSRLWRETVELLAYILATGRDPRFLHPTESPPQLNELPASGLRSFERKLKLARLFSHTAEGRQMISWYI